MTIVITSEVLTAAVLLLCAWMLLLMRWSGAVTERRRNVRDDVADTVSRMQAITAERKRLQVIERHIYELREDNERILCQIREVAGTSAVRPREHAPTEVYKQ